MWRASPRSRRLCGDAFLPRKRMSETVVPSSDEVAAPAVQSQRSFVAHAKLIGFFTLISRILGMAREAVSAHFFGAGVVASAFTVAFAIPNLFRKLFGEGALSAAFIPLYAQAIKTHHEDDARSFAAASVNLLLASRLTASPSPLLPTSVITEGGAPLCRAHGGGGAPPPWRPITRRVAPRRSSAGWRRPAGEWHRAGLRGLR